MARKNAAARSRVQAGSPVDYESYPGERATFRIGHRLLAESVEGFITIYGAEGPPAFHRPSLPFEPEAAMHVVKAFLTAPFAASL
jgi:hypothetical protein